MDLTKLKQNLKIKIFVGTTLSAVMVQMDSYAAGGTEKAL